MAHALLGDAIINGLTTPTLPNNPGKTDCASIRDTHRLINAKSKLIESPHGGGHNGHLRIVLTATQYTLVIQVPFFFPANSVQTLTTRLR